MYGGAVKEFALTTMGKYEKFDKIVGYEIDDYTLRLHIQIAPEKRKTIVVLEPEKIVTWEYSLEDEGRVNARELFAEIDAKIEEKEEIRAYNCFRDKMTQICFSLENKIDKCMNTSQKEARKSDSAGNATLENTAPPADQLFPRKKRFLNSLSQKEILLLLEAYEGFERKTSYKPKDHSEVLIYKVHDGKLVRKTEGDGAVVECDLDETREFLQTWMLCCIFRESSQAIVRRILLSIFLSSLKSCRERRFTH